MPRGRHNLVIEIGTMFTEKEGRSTLLISAWLRDRDVSGLFVSVDNQVEHIEASKQIIQAYDPQLCEEGWVSWRHGNSLSVLQSVLSENVDANLAVAFLDGGGSPEYNLQELDLLLAHTASGAVFLIDDFVFLEPTERYRWHRELGKGQTIYAVLLIAQALAAVSGLREGDIRLDRDRVGAQFDFARALATDPKTLDYFSRFLELDFLRVANCMLLVGGRDKIAELRGTHATKNNIPLDRLPPIDDAIAYSGGNVPNV